MCWICDLELKQAKRLSVNEKQTAKLLDDMFKRQYRELIRRKPWKDGASTAYLHNEQHHLETFYTLREGAESALARGIKTGERKGGVKLPDAVDRRAYKDIHRNLVERSATSINDTTSKKLDAMYDRLSAKGTKPISATDYKKEAKAIFGITEEGDNWRAKRIAITQETKGKNHGEVMVYKETGSVEKVMWQAKSGACPFCNKLNGKTQFVDTPFVTKGTTLTARGVKKIIRFNVNYEDVVAPPLHVNCRCVLVPVMKGKKK